MFFKKHPFMVFFVLSGFFSVSSLIIACFYNNFYLSRHVFEGDSSSYYFFQINSFFNSIRMGTANSLIYELTNNARNPFRIVPYLIFNPQSLVTYNGHLIVADLMLFFYVLLFGYLIYKRTKSMTYSSYGMFLIFTPACFFDPTLGFPANYPDLHASYFVGAALSSLFLSDFGKKGRWLFIFGTFIALASLSRFISAGFCFVICAPILFYFIYLRYCEEKNILINVITPLCLVLSPIVLLSGYFLYTFTLPNLHFYDVAGYELGRGVDLALNNVGKSYKTYLGAALIFLMIITFFRYVIYNKPKINQNEFLLTAWAACSHPLLFVFVLKVGDDIRSPLYALPGIFLLCLAPYTCQHKSISEKTELRRNFFMFFLVFILIIWSNAMLIKKYEKISNDEISNIIFSKSISNLTKLYSQGEAPLLNRPIAFDTFFYEYGHRIVLENALSNKYELKWAHLYEVHKTGWLLSYPNHNLSDLKSELYIKTKNSLDLVWIIDNPNLESAKILFNNDWSIEIVNYMNLQITKNTRDWRFITKIDSPWGAISLYKNTHKLH